jgi:RNA polymerase sigma factor (sigma-70 family)
MRLAMRCRKSFCVTLSSARSRIAALSHETTAEHLDQIPDTSPGPDRNLRSTELARELTSILSARELDCLRLRGEGLSYAEIGDVLGITTGTVGALLSRVYRKLRPSEKENVIGVADALRLLFVEVRHDPR